MQIEDSISGPSQDAILAKPVDLIKKIKLFYFGLILVILNLVFTHTMVLFKSDIYFFVGPKAFILYLGGWIVIINFHSFLKILPYPIKLDLPSIYPFLIAIIVSFVIDENFENYYSYSLLLLSSMALGVRLLFNIKYIKNQADNSLLKFRISMSYSVVMIYGLFLMNLFIFTFPDNKRLFINNIEMYMFIQGLIATLLSFSLYLILSIPQSIQKLGSISDRDFYLNRDPRFDYNWSPTDRTYYFEEVKEDDREEIFNGDSNYVLFYDFGNRNLKETKNILLNYNSFFDSKLFLECYTIDEEYVVKSLLTQKDTVYISSEANTNLDKVLDYIYQNFGYKIKLQNHISVDKFEYLNENFEFAFISVFKSPWNRKGKIWILVSNQNVQTVLSQFVNKFGTYVISISNEKPIIAILKFPIEGNDIIEIQSSENDKTIPEQNSITLL